MNTLSIIIFLISSLGTVVATVFLFLGLFIKSMRDTMKKSLVALGIFALIGVGSLVAVGITLPESSQSMVADSTQDSESEVTSVKADEFAETSNSKSTSDIGKDDDRSENVDNSDSRNKAIYEDEGQKSESKDNLGTDADTKTDTNIEERKFEELQVHFIDVGQGDATLITCDNQAMLIDAGENDKGTAVQLYLQKRGITGLDYIIGTHPDSDHIGGMDVILTKFDCKKIILPDVSNDTRTYRDVIDAMDYKGYINTLPKVGITYPLGDAEFTIIAPNGTYEDTNNYSVGIKLVHGENSFVFTGDAEEDAEADILQTGLDLSADVLKVGHHGSKSSTTRDFLDAVNPVYAVISCGEGNSYGHPSAQTLNSLRSSGIKVFRTDEQGSIVAVSDGIDLTFNCSPSESWLAGEPDVGQETTAKYIINVNTLKFHYADCSSVKAMSDKNKLPSNKSRDEIIAEGYDPCGRCNP